MTVGSRLREAADILQLGESFSLEEVQAQYRQLLKQYHPDHCSEMSRFCEEKTRQVVEAYRLLYVAMVKHCIRLDDLEATTPGEFWMRRFASDGVWGNPQEKKKKR